jgi:hypothetical protein
MGSERRSAGRSSVGQRNDGRSSAACRMSHSWESGTVEIPRGIFERVSALCLALPEVTVRVDASRVKVRSTAHSFDIRRRSFCLLIALEGANGTGVPQLVLRADPADREGRLKQDTSPRRIPIAAKLKQRMVAKAVAGSTPSSRLKRSSAMTTARARMQPRDRPNPGCRVTPHGSRRPRGRFAASSVAQAPAPSRRSATCSSREAG